MLAAKPYFAPWNRGRWGQDGHTGQPETPRMNGECRKQKVQIPDISDELKNASQIVSVKKRTCGRPGKTASTKPYG